MTDEAKVLAFVLRRGEWDRELCKYFPTDERNQAADLIETQARENAAKDAEIERLREALGWFLNDSRFVVQVGGNPNVVPQMIEAARAALAGDSHDQ